MKNKKASFGRNMRSVARGALGAAALAAALRGSNILYNKTVGRLLSDPEPEDIEIFINPQKKKEEEEDDLLKKYSSDKSIRHEELYKVAFLQKVALSMPSMKSLTNALAGAKKFFNVDKARKSTILDSIEDIPQTLSAFRKGKEDAVGGAIKSFGDIVSGQKGPNNSVVDEALDVLSRNIGKATKGTDIGDIDFSSLKGVGGDDIMGQVKLTIGKAFDPDKITGKNFDDMVLSHSDKMSTVPFLKNLFAENKGKAIAGGVGGLGLYEAMSDLNAPGGMIDKAKEMVPGGGRGGFSDAFYTALGVVPGFMIAHEVNKKIEKHRQDQEFEDKVREIELMMNRRHNEDDLEKTSAYLERNMEMYKCAMIDAYCRGFNNKLLKIANEQPKIKEKLTKQANKVEEGIVKSAGLLDSITGSTSDIGGSVTDAAGMGVKSLGLASKLYPAMLGVLGPLGFLMGRNLASYHLEDPVAKKDKSRIIFKTERDDKDKKKRKK